MVVDEGDLKFSTTDRHQWFFYAWFVIGIFGLNWSKDGLLGVEIAMLRTPRWQAHDVTALMMHMQNRWSGPVGWIYWIRHVRPKGCLCSHKLLTLLSCLTFLIFVGLPLSGLALNITEGFILSSSSPLVIGRNRQNLYDRQPDDSLNLLVNSWKTGSFPIVPGYGILYTPRNISRGDYENLKKFPNTLPLTKSTPDIFLAPQAEYPIAGEPWGLRATYNCSIVQDASTFTILNERPSSSLDVSRNYSQRAGDEIPWATFLTPSGNSISSFIAAPWSGPGNNLWGYVEIGRSEILPGEYESPEDTLARNGLDIYYSNRRGVLEYALWQIRRKNSYNETEYRPSYSFNDTLEPTIRGMPSPTLQLDNGTWIWNTTFFRVNKRNGTDALADGTADIREYLGPYGSFFPDEPVSWIQSVADPIGVRCEYTSAVGTATLEPKTSSFSSFTHVPPMWDATQYRNRPLGFYAAEVMTARFFELFTSTGSPPPVVISNFPAYQTYIQPLVLLKSTMLVFGLDALHIMYDSANGFEGGWRGENLKSSKKGNVITPGVISFYIPLTFLGLWAAICLGLAACYGFRARLSDKLDDHILAELREKLENRLD
ncbi:hypothetical protein ABW19_dt0203341 [Dactylella cylindrospora]|nr:hypothetical protein ABW19_dt0203341 [Dactylella cylindrospora]